MDELEIKQGSSIQQTQYFIPVEIYLSVRNLKHFVLALSNRKIGLRQQSLTHCLLCLVIVKLSHELDQ
jgi:hypothetical protein